MSIIITLIINVNITVITEQSAQIKVDYYNSIWRENHFNRTKTWTIITINIEVDEIKVIIINGQEYGTQSN